MGSVFNTVIRFAQGACAVLVAVLLLIASAANAAPLSDDIALDDQVWTNSSSVSQLHATVENVVDAVWQGTEVAVGQEQRHNLEVGQCAQPDERIYTDNTVVENGGPSTLNGTLEIYIDAPVRITCIRIDDQVTDGTGAVPWIHSGGLGESWVFVGVQAQYGKGFNFNIHIYGVPAENN